MTRCDVAIVGGGFSGVAVAAQLARRAESNLSVALFEDGDVGRGAAYGTPYGAHLLNTRAAAMSAFPDDPDHFVRWLDGRAAPRDFVSRATYGDYVADIANRVFERDRFGVVRDRVVAVERAGFEFSIQTATGRCWAARSVVLATGHASPNHDFLPQALIEHPGYVADPWRFDYRPVGGRVLVIGSGLTALDVLVALESSGHRGAVHVLSRRGRFPEVHADGVAPYDVLPVLDAADARSLLRSFRRHVGHARERGFDWRAVVDALRPESEALWARLPAREKRRFDRHLRSRWERYRHRAPQSVDAVRERYLRAGRFHVHAGRVGGFDAGTVTIDGADGRPVRLRPDWIVNCTGPGRERRLSADPPFARMLADGLVSPEPLGLGIRVDADLAAIDAAGHRVDGLWVVGPLAKGSRFEATAVPELRVMAQEVAAGALRARSRSGNGEASAQRYFCMAMQVGELNHLYTTLPASGSALAEN